MQVIWNYLVFYVNEKLREIKAFSSEWGVSFRQTVD